MAEIIEEIGIVVDDGSVKVPIKNKMGDEIGVFYFRPTDIGIISRFNEASDRFSKVVEPLNEVNINPDGTADDEAGMRAIEEATTRLYDLCNYLFGGNMAEAFFGTMKPFSPINGSFYCENALNAAAHYVGMAFDKEVKKVNARVEKYTHGVRTGKHKDGKQ